MVKLTDYPFVYSLVGLLLAMSGHRVNLDSISFSTLGPLITIIGLFATILSIGDPFGNLLRFGISRAIPRDMMGIDVEKYREMATKASKTNWISYEIDKIVSTIYFLIILIVIFIAINNQPFLNDVFKSFGFSGNATCIGSQCEQMRGNMSSVTSSIQPSTHEPPQFLSNGDLKLFLLVILAISIAGIVAVLYFAVDRLKWHNISVATYFFSEFKPPNGIDPSEYEYLRKSFTDSLEKRDWGMADYYSMKLGHL